MEPRPQLGLEVEEMGTEEHSVPVGAPPQAGTPPPALERPAAPVVPRADANSDAGPVDDQTPEVTISSSTGTLPPVPDHDDSDLIDPPPANDPGSAGVPPQPNLTTDSASEFVAPPTGAGAMQADDEYADMPPLAPSPLPEDGADAPSPTAVPITIMSTKDPLPPSAVQLPSGEKFPPPGSVPLPRGDIREKPATPWDDLTGDIQPPREGFDFGVPRNMKHERHRPNEVVCASTVEEMGIDRIWVSDNRFMRPTSVFPHLYETWGLRPWTVQELGICGTWMDTGRCYNGCNCRNLHIRSLQDVKDIRDGRYSEQFLRATQSRTPARDLSGFFTLDGVAFEWEYPYFGIAQRRPFYHMRGRYFDEDWPMPRCPFQRTDYPA